MNIHFSQPAEQAGAVRLDDRGRDEVPVRHRGGHGSAMHVVRLPVGGELALRREDELVGHSHMMSIISYRGGVKDPPTDMQDNMWARLRDSRPGACLIHAT